MSRKTYSYFIDDSGGFPIKKDWFISCCIITDTPEKLRAEIQTLETQIVNEAINQPSWERIKQKGFHACEDNKTIRDRFISLLVTLNFRAYILIRNPKKELKEAISSLSYQQLISERLLRERLIKRKDALNKIYIEQNENNPTNERKERSRQAFQTALTEYIPNVEVTVAVCEKKEEPILSISDYIAHIFRDKFFSQKGSKDTRQERNYTLIEPKIALVYDLSGVHFGMRRSLDKQNLRDYYSIVNS